MKILFLLWTLVTFCIRLDVGWSHRVVSISYQDLANAFDGSTRARIENEDTSCPEHLLAAIAQAFGPRGLGFLEITDIPPRLVELRSLVLSMAPQLATLPTDQLDALTLPQTGYTIGWSHGKEQFGIDKSGNPIYDTRKGSFYLDPFRNHNNVFPTKALPSLEPALLEVTRAMTQVAVWVSQLCDAFLHTTSTSSTSHDRDHHDPPSGLSSASIHQSLKSRINTKARLLYYFPQQSFKDNEPTMDDDWCGWHKDHGSLTVLLPGMLFHDKEPSAIDKSSSRHPPQPKPGLYIQSRSTENTENTDTTMVPIDLPPTSLGVQVGETIEIMSGGRMVATPHAVMSKGNPMGGRASLAVFLQPEADQILPPCPPTADLSLQARHRPTFGAFQQATTKAFQ